MNITQLISSALRCAVIRTMVLFSLYALSLFVCPAVYAQAVVTSQRADRGATVLTLANDKVECTVTIDSLLRSDRLASLKAWTETFQSGPSAIETDADFGLEVMWTDWQAPRKVNCAENPVSFTKQDFRVQRHEFRDVEKGAKELDIFLQAVDVPSFCLRIAYRLEPKAFYVHRQMAVFDSTGIGHFLQVVAPRQGTIAGDPAIVKDGGFGQPIAFTLSSGGGYFGMEYPAADNAVQKTSTGTTIRCSQEIGERIGKTWLESDWVVEGIAPNAFVKQWFMRYVDDIRVAPLAPYTLYNSWYDLRSAEYPHVPEGNVMNEKNIMRIIDLMRTNMIEKHHIKLDAFVLDDGWDVYKSDWVLRQEQFPRGLKPIADELKKTDTHLGLWFGPIGGYSFRKQRVGWMQEHGYEVTGDQMCVAGKNYSKLLTQRVGDFTEKEGVSYYKWDGIQFSCSDPAHGHPVGIYSRRATMQTVIAMCDTVRAQHPEMFLNISSGTWLSPWWVKYANQIWMQGEDYGYADVPSISPRDAAITYRDLSLYDDFSTNNFWFPIQNLMTHGIIKGNLEMLGGREEPLEKFTNEVLLYFARGVSMWELYISPDILTEGEWDAMGQAMHWARDRFPILSTTEMVGGDPKKRETYGYVHFNGTRGIIAARNPWIESSALEVLLSPEQGLDPGASSLVLEQVYPVRRIFTELYRAGAKIKLPLDGYETAIYELYPLSEAKEPLVAGVPFDVSGSEGKNYRLSLYGTDGDVRLLNPDMVEQMQSNGQSASLDELVHNLGKNEDPVEKQSMVFSTENNGITIGLTVHSSVQSASLSLLLTPDNRKSALPAVVITTDGKEDTARFERGEGSSTWYTVPLTAGKHRSAVKIVPGKGQSGWNGHVTAWVVCKQKQQSVPVEIIARNAAPDRPMPPRPLPPGERIVNVKVGETSFKF